jgi:hypothetical protein
MSSLVRRGRRSRLDRAALLDRLAAIESDRADDEPIAQASLARTLLTLVDVNQETEYLLCGRAARHLLGELPGGVGHEF